MQTLLLDLETGDLVIDANANIAVASDPYSLAQDACSAIKLFSGELYYDTTQGVAYLPGILGTLPPIALVKNQFVAAALIVPEVVSAQVFFSSINQQRQLSGQVQIKSAAGVTATAVLKTTIVPQPPTQPFILGSSTLGGTDVLL
jgi:hypothetical protein